MAQRPNRLLVWMLAGCASIAFTFSPAFAQSGSGAPVISANGIVNAASYTQPSFPGGSLAQGTLFTIFGANLGPAVAPPEPGTYPLGTSLAGVSIKVSQGATVVNALPFYVSATQVSAILPSNTPLGSDAVVVTYNGQSSAPANVNVVAASVGIFAINSGGTGPSVLQNYVSATQLPVNSKTTSAAPGQTLILYGTGLGPALNADSQPPAAGPLAAKTEIFVGNLPAAVSYSGRSPCCSGLDQFAFVVPANASLGCNVPVLIRTNGVTSSNVVTIAISANGGACSDAVAPLGNITGAGKFGTILLLRGSLGSTPTTAIASDLLAATFRTENGGPFAFNPLFSAPPKGACTSYTSAGNVFGSGIIPGFGPTAGALSAGKLSVTNGKSTVTAKPTPAYSAALSTQTGGAGFLDLGPFTVSGGGSGTSIGAFSANVNAVPIITWSNVASSVSRSAGLPVSWTFSGTGSSSGEAVIIAGGNWISAANTSAMFFCVAAAGDGSFTVPPYILARIPASGSAPGTSLGAVMVGALPSSPETTFSASGLDLGTVNMGSVNGAPVTFQ